MLFKIVDLWVSESSTATWDVMNVEAPPGSIIEMLFEAAGTWMTGTVMVWAPLENF